MPFEEGNTYSKGRPKGALNQFTRIKQRILQSFEDRDKDDKELKKMDFTDLFKGIVSLMPKNIILEGGENPIQIQLNEDVDKKDKE